MDYSQYTLQPPLQQNAIIVRMSPPWLRTHTQAKVNLKFNVSNSVLRSHEKGVKTVRLFDSIVRTFRGQQIQEQDITLKAMGQSTRLICKEPFSTTVEWLIARFVVPKGCFWNTTLYMRSISALCASSPPPSPNCVWICVEWVKTMDFAQRKVLRTIPPKVGDPSKTNKK